MTIIRHEKHIGLLTKPCWCDIASEYKKSRGIQGDDCPAHKKGRFGGEE